MTRVTDLKTECVKKFIEMMRKWAEYHEIKRDTLVDLRKQFAVDSAAIDKLAAEILSNPRVAEAHPLVESLKVSWQKIVKNYKIGNSFY